MFAHIKQYISSSINASFLYRGIAHFALLLLVLGVKAQKYYVIYYDDMVIADEELIVPHPSMHKRRFVLMPLCEIAPDFIHPLFRESNRELLARCEDRLRVRLR